MRTIDIIRRAGGSLKQAKARTLLTALAISVGSFTLTMALAAGQGAREYADRLISSNADVQALNVTKADQTGFDNFSQPQEYDPDALEVSEGFNIKRLTQQDITELENTEGVASVTPVYNVNAQYITRADQKKYTTTVEVYNPGLKPDLEVGTLPQGDDPLSEDAIILPASYVSLLGFTSSEEAVGQTVTLRVEKQNAITQQQIQDVLQEEGPEGVAELNQTDPRDYTFTITGVTGESSTALDFSNAVQISSERAKQMAEFLTEGTDDYQKYIGALVRIEEGQDVVAVEGAVENKGYSAQTAEDAREVLFSIVNTLQGIVIGFGALSLIAAVFGIINTQYISVLERTQQIGLMKALGMRGKDVARLFRYEAAWIGFLGGVLGAVFAWLVGTLLNPWISDVLAIGEENQMLIFGFLPATAIVAGLIIVAIVAGAFPARKAAKLDPIEALRTE